MKNKQVREYASANNVKLWQVAEVYGMSDSSFSRKLRKEFTPELKNKTLSIIDQIVNQNKAGE